MIITLGQAMQYYKQLWLSTLGLTLLIPQVVLADISGKVFRDFNANGTLDTGGTLSEVGVAGITVKAFAAADAVNPMATTTSATDGTYTLTGLSSATPYRLEFSEWSAGYFPAPAPATNIQFQTNPATQVNFGIVAANEYYNGTTPNVLTSLLSNGNQTTGTKQTLISMPYNASADWYGDVSTQAIDTDTGSVYGIAYDAQKDRIFSSAYLKRHAGLGSAGLDAIYVTQRGTNTSNVFVELQNDLGINVGTIGSNAARGLTTTTAPSHDVDAFNQVGEIGLGDIDLSADGKTLYVVNLFDKKLYAIAVDSDNNPATRPTATDVTAYSVPTPASCSATTHTHLRVNLGGHRHVETNGDAWMRSSFHIGGQEGIVTDSVDVSAPGTAEEAIYKTFWAYVDKVEVPLKNGTYTVKLHYVDFWGSPTGRSFDVDFENGQVVESAFNIYNAAGGNGKAVAKTYTVTVTDNFLNIDFNAVVDSTMLSGMEIIGQTNESAGQWRPFAIGLEGSDVFVGGVCDAANSQNPADLKATVYRLNKAGNNFTEVLSAPLDYEKGMAYNVCVGQQGWFGWLPDNTLPSTCSHDGGITYPQPMLTDIEFLSDRSMILGLRDRLGDQSGLNNYPLTGTTLVWASTAGDVLRAGWVNGSYQLEQNGSVAGLSSVRANNQEGPAGGEFYADNYGTGHAETSMGSLASHKGFNHLLHARINPQNTMRSGGLAWLNNTDGEQNRGYQVYSQEVESMGKAAGLGDVELVLPLAPVEIGNRVWLDTDNDGIQDAGENGIPNVAVELRAGATVLATATTAADGTYYFSNATGTTTASKKYGLTQLQPNAAYTVKFPTTVTVAGTTYDLTTATMGSNTSIDSNAPATGEVMVGATDIPSAGANNHSFDVGYASAPPPPAGCTTITNTANISKITETDSVAGNNTASVVIQANCTELKTDLKLVKTANKTTVKKGDTLIYTLTLNNESDVDATEVKVADNLPTSLELVNATPQQGTFVNGVWDVGTVKARTTLTLTLETRVK